MELSWHSREPLRLANGAKLGCLRDGDEVVITAGGGGVELGEVVGQTLSAGLDRPADVPLFELCTRRNVSARSAGTPCPPVGAGHPHGSVVP